MANNKNNKTSLLVTTALMTALVVLCTVLLKIPVGPDCYIHLGDTVIVMAAFMLPMPYACFAGAVGASLADLIGGFAFWAPWTFVVKLLMVLVLSFFIKKAEKNTHEKYILGVQYIEFFGLVLAGIVAVLGYFLSEFIMFGSIAPAATCIPFNIIQVTLASIIAELLYGRLNKQ